MVGLIQMKGNTLPQRRRTRPEERCHPRPANAFKCSRLFVQKCLYPRFQHCLGGDWRIGSLNRACTPTSRCFRPFDTAQREGANAVTECLWQRYDRHNTIGDFMIGDLYGSRQKVSSSSPHWRLASPGAVLKLRLASCTVRNKQLVVDRLC